MIRHDDEYTAPPNAASLPMSDNIKQRGCTIAANQIIRPAGARADRDEEGRFLRNDAERSFMREAFSLRIVHWSKMSWSGRLGPAVPTKNIFSPGRVRWLPKGHLRPALRDYGSADRVPSPP